MNLVQVTFPLLLPTNSNPEVTATPTLGETIECEANLCRLVIESFEIPSEGSPKGSAEHDQLQNR